MTLPEALDLQAFLLRHFAYEDQGRQTVLRVRLTRYCGHDEVLSLPLHTGPADIERHGRQHCGHCQEAWEAKVMEAQILAEHRAEHLGLPALMGSAKQVAWANQLRVKAVDRHGMDHIGEVVRNETWAKWWIDNRARLRGMPVFREWQEAVELFGPVETGR